MLNVILRVWVLLVVIQVALWDAILSNEAALRSLCEWQKFAAWSAVCPNDAIVGLVVVVDCNINWLVLIRVLLQRLISEQGLTLVVATLGLASPIGMLVGLLLGEKGMTDALWSGGPRHQCHSVVPLAHMLVVLLLIILYLVSDEWIALVELISCISCINWVVVIIVYLT